MVIRTVGLEYDGAWMIAVAFLRLAGSVCFVDYVRKNEFHVCIMTLSPSYDQFYGNRARQGTTFRYLFGVSTPEDAETRIIEGVSFKWLIERLRREFSDKCWIREGELEGEL